MEFQKPSLSSKQLTMQAVGKCDFPLTTPIYNSHSLNTRHSSNTQIMFMKKRHFNESAVANGDDIQACIFENHLNPLLCKFN